MNDQLDWLERRNLGIERAEGEAQRELGLLPLEPLPGFMNTRLSHR
jgi:hypothetical protein